MLDDITVTLQKASWCQYVEARNFNPQQAESNDKDFVVISATSMRKDVRHLNGEPNIPRCCQVVDTLCQSTTLYFGTTRTRAARASPDTRDVVGSNSHVVKAWRSTPRHSIAGHESDICSWVQLCQESGVFDKTFSSSMSTVPVQPAVP